MLTLNVGMQDREAEVTEMVSCVVCARILDVCPCTSGLCAFHPVQSGGLHHQVF